MFVDHLVSGGKGKSRSFQPPQFDWATRMNAIRGDDRVDSEAMESEEYSEEEMNDYLAGMDEEQKVCMLVSLRSCCWSEEPN